MSVEWEPSVWYECDARLRAARPRHPQEEVQLAQLHKKGVRAKEEVLETLVILNLQTILEEPLRFLVRAGDYWGLQDITAVDPLGRVHLFELKKDSIGRDVPAQLATYLLTNMFTDAREYASWAWSLNKRLLHGERWALYLAAALVNERTTTFGRKALYRELGIARITDGCWKKMNQNGEAAALKLRALLAMTGQTHQLPSLPELHRWADATARSLLGDRPELPLVTIQPHGAIWLVGRSFADDALEQVAQWRRAGVDARFIEVDARQVEADGRWIIRVRREAYPERRELLDRVYREGAALLAEHDQTAGPSSPPLQIKLRLYNRLAASKMKKSEKRGKTKQAGHPLSGDAYAVLSTGRGEDGSKEELRRWTVDD